MYLIENKLIASIKFRNMYKLLNRISNTNVKLAKKTI